MMHLLRKNLLSYLTKGGISLVVLVVLFAPFGQIPNARAQGYLNSMTAALTEGTASPGNSPGNACATGQIPDGKGGCTALPKVESSDFACGITSGQGVANCVASLVYYIGPGLASNVAYIGAYIFSFSVSLSLNSIAYALDFLSTGWTTVRDLANMAFILILVYIAFIVMFEAET